jgi:hypothetical protein
MCEQESIIVIISVDVNEHSDIISTNLSTRSRVPAAGPTQKRGRRRATRTGSASAAHTSHTHPPSASQSKHVQNCSKYLSFPHTPYPAAIHACSCALTQNSGNSVCPSKSSVVDDPSVTLLLLPLPLPTTMYAEYDSGSDHTFVGRETPSLGPGPCANAVIERAPAKWCQRGVERQGPEARCGGRRLC